MAANSAWLNRSRWCSPSSLAFRLGLGLAVLTGAPGCKRGSGSQEPEPRAEAGVEPSGQGSLSDAPRSAPNCAARTARGALGLVPDASEWIAHVGPRAVLASNSWAPMAEFLGEDANWNAVVGLFEGCGVGLEDLDHLLIGFNTEEEFVVALSGPTIGRPEVAQCLILAIQAFAGDEPIAEPVAWDEDPSVTIIEFTDGRAYLFGDEVLALTTTGWEDEVGRLSRCQGSPAIAGAGRELLANVEINAPLWLTGRVRPGVAAEYEATVGVPEGSVQAVALSVRLEQGVTMLGHVQLRDAAAATTLADTVRSGLSLLSATLQPEFKGALGRATVDTVGAAVVVNAAATDAELRSLFSPSP